MISAAAIIIGTMPSFYAVLCAEILHGTTAGIITPAIGAISLGLVGRRAMSLRTGRNYRFAAAGHAITSAPMGFAGAYFSEQAIFFVAAILCIPALVALAFINANEIDYARARNAGIGERAHEIGAITDLLKNHKLVLFAAALVLFQLVDASMLPLTGEHLGASAGANSSLWISGLITIPQVVVAILAPWVGFHSERKPPAVVAARLRLAVPPGRNACRRSKLYRPHYHAGSRWHYRRNCRGSDGPGNN
jgi:hypothetical protein